MASRTSSTAWLNPAHYTLGASLRQRVSELVRPARPGLPDPPEPSPRPRHPASPV